MMLKELLGKEVIDYCNGKKYGEIKEADLILDGSSERIESIILHNKLPDAQLMVIPCYAIKHVGSRVVVVDIMNKISPEGKS